MNRYWNFSERERSELTGDNVRALLSVEMMEKGVLKVEPPVLMELQPCDVPTVAAYEVLYHGEYSSDHSSGFAFATAGEADSFIALHPLLIDTRWEYGSTKFLVPCQEMKIQKIELPNEVAMTNKAVILKANKAAKEANEKSQSQYHKDMKSVEDATKGVWDDWHECREKAARCKKVADTRAEYVTLSGGDKAIAEEFLKKAFDEERLKEAAEWLGDEDAE
jgi:hypothetical protein